MNEHEMGLVHRDLKPSNILVARTKDNEIFPVFFL
jgi:serine/threonine protein kinase